ncbi:MAG: hypothetical protein JWM31_2846 [Solirubrobacterales bacterium]|nr:hypothetical protein [Solirubrobacterales bacterium]
MSTVTSGTRTAGRSAAGRPRRRRPVTSMAFDALFERATDGPSLDDVLVGAWKDLAAHRTVTCPVCTSAAMRPRYGSGEGTVGGRCGDCGTVLG